MSSRNRSAGVKALRQAYEEALRLAVNPVEEQMMKKKMPPLNMKYCVHSGITGFGK